MKSVIRTIILLFVGMALASAQTTRIASTVAVLAPGQTSVVLPMPVLSPGVTIQLLKVRTSVIAWGTTTPEPMSITVISGGIPIVGQRIILYSNLMVQGVLPPVFYDEDVSGPEGVWYQSSVLVANVTATHVPNWTVVVTVTYQMTTAP